MTHPLNRIYPLYSRWKENSWLGTKYREGAMPLQLQAVHALEIMAREALEIPEPVS